jgi:hypothetical protein
VGGREEGRKEGREQGWKDERDRRKAGGDRERGKRSGKEGKGIRTTTQTDTHHKTLSIDH